MKRLYPQVALAVALAAFAGASFASAAPPPGVMQLPQGKQLPPAVQHNIRIKIPKGHKHRVVVTSRHIKQQGLPRQARGWNTICDRVFSAPGIAYGISGSRPDNPLRVRVRIDGKLVYDKALTQSATTTIQPPFAKLTSAAR